MTMISPNVLSILQSNVYHHGNPRVGDNLLHLPPGQRSLSECIASRQHEIEFRNHSTFVVSFLGVQKSGKSTTANAIFDTGFPTGRDNPTTRTTEGVDASLGYLEQCQEQIIVLDAEGLNRTDCDGLTRTNRDDYNLVNERIKIYNRRLAVFTACSSSVVVLMCKGDVTSEFRRFAEICKDASQFLRSQETKPALFILFNSRDEPWTGEETIKEESRLLSESLIAEVNDDEDILRMCFSSCKFFKLPHTSDRLQYRRECQRIRLQVQKMTRGKFYDPFLPTENALKKSTRSKLFNFQNLPGYLDELFKYCNQDSETIFPDINRWVQKNGNQKNKQSPKIGGRVALSVGAIGTATAAAGTVGLSPIPFSDWPLLLAIEIALVTSLAVIWSIRKEAISARLVKRLFTRVIGGMGALGIFAVGGKVLGTLLKFIPGPNIVGMILDAGLSATIVGTLGIVITVIFAIMFKTSNNGSSGNGSMTEEELYERLERYDLGNLSAQAARGLRSGGNVGDIITGIMENEDAFEDDLEDLRNNDGWDNPRNLCMGCQSDDCEFAVLPCNHQVLCTQCVQDGRNCPYCHSAN